MNRKVFLLGTTIGLIPRILFYLLLGAGIAPILETDFALGLTIIALIIIFLLFLLYIVKKLFFKGNNLRLQQKDVNV